MRPGTGPLFTSCSVNSVNEGLSISTAQVPSPLKRQSDWLKDCNAGKSSLTFAASHTPGLEYETSAAKSWNSLKLEEVRFAAGAATPTSSASGFPTRRTATPRTAPATSLPRRMWPKRPTPKPSPGLRDARRDRSPSRGAHVHHEVFTGASSRKT